MMEVLIAVMVLGLVVTASLKLIALSQKALSDVRDRERVIDVVAGMQIELARDPFNIFGVSGDLEWDVREREEPLLMNDDINADALGITREEAEVQKQKMRDERLRWRELAIKYKGTEIKLFLAYSEEYARAVSEDPTIGQR